MPGISGSFDAERQPDGHDAELRATIVALVGGDGPALRVLVQDGRVDARLELDVPAQVEAVGDVVRRSAGSPAGCAYLSLHSHSCSSSLSNENE